VKSENRNPKSEKIPMTKIRTKKILAGDDVLAAFGSHGGGLVRARNRRLTWFFRFRSFGLFSDFEFRISDFRDQTSDP